MRNLKTLTALALAALALTAASASADIVDPVSGDPYVGEVAGVNTGANPTFVSSSWTITCSVATIGGTMDGNAPATGTLDFAWSGCRIGNGINCTFADMNEVSINIDESPTAPDSQIINTSRAESFISCALAFNCAVYSDPANGSEVEADVAGGSNPVATIADTVNVSGTGCPSTIGWNAQYEITGPEDGLESND